MVKKIIVKRKYKAVRIPIDVYNDAVTSQRKLNQTATTLLGKPVRIPLTKVFRIKMRIPTTIPDELIKSIAKGKNVI